MGNKNIGFGILVPVVAQTIRPKPVIVKIRGKIPVAKNIFELLVKKAKENNVHKL